MILEHLLGRDDADRVMSIGGVNGDRLACRQNPRVVGAALVRVAAALDRHRLGPRHTDRQFALQSVGPDADRGAVAHPRHRHVGDVDRIEFEAQRGTRRIRAELVCGEKPGRSHLCGGRLVAAGGYDGPCGGRTPCRHEVAGQTGGRRGGDVHDLSVG